MGGVSTFEVRRGADRARTRTEWLDSRHSFAFGSHYDPDNLGFGVLLAFNEDILQPGPGYPVHAHRDVEILTWVVAGSLVHSEAGGTSAVIGAGQLHHLSAGSGIRHTEFSAGGEPVRVVQMWLSPDEYGLPPSYRVLAVGDRLDSGELVEVASGLVGSGEGGSEVGGSEVGGGDGDGAGGDDGAGGVLRIRQRAAALSVARLSAGAAVPLPPARYLHVYLTTGSVTVESANGDVADLAAGDALRITGGGGEQVRAGEPAELLVWRMQAGIG